MQPVRKFAKNCCGGAVGYDGHRSPTRPRLSPNADNAGGLKEMDMEERMAAMICGAPSLVATVKRAACPNECLRTG